MRIRRGEVAAAVVVVCAVVGIWAFGQVRAQVRDDQRRSFEEAHKERYSQASAIVLDSEEQRRCVDGEGHTYSADFGWEGRMEAVVQEAVCYGDPSEVPGLEPDDFRSWQNAESVVVVKMRLTNVDAFVPSAEESHRDPYGFNASIFNLRGSSVDDRAVVAGRGDLEPSPTNGYHFVLAPGQSTVLEIAYGLDSPEKPSLVVLNIGADGSEADKISVDLAPLSAEVPAESGEA